MDRSPSASKCREALNGSYLLKFMSPLERIENILKEIKKRQLQLPENHKKKSSSSPSAINDVQYHQAPWASPATC